MDTTPTPPAITGAAITAWRDALGLTQSGAAALLGVSRQTVINWERGTHAPPLSARRKMRDATARVRAAAAAQVRDADAILRVLIPRRRRRKNAVGVRVR